MRMRPFFATLFAGLLTGGLSSSVALASEPQPLNYNTFNPESHAGQTLQTQPAQVVSNEYKDLDQDGIADKFDQCPNTLLNAQVDAKGCELDSDQDGVVNRLDLCPNTAPGAVVNRFGCEGDDDNDGVVNSKDQCPDTPAGLQVDAKGCKLISDADKDGIKDPDDLCPNTPANTAVNSKGCAPQALSLSNIEFDSNRHAIRADQVSILETDAGKLADLEASQVILITGHTDWQGNNKTLNEPLSWRRANSVKNFLVPLLDYSASRIYILGKGELDPIATNKTAAGRQQNRRIEMQVLATEKLPKEAELVLPAGYAKP